MFFCGQPGCTGRIGLKPLGRAPRASETGAGAGQPQRPAAFAREPRQGGKKSARRPVSRVLYPPRRTMAIHLGRPLPDASRDLPGRRRENPPAGSLVLDGQGPGAPSLLGLAPGGVCPAAPVAGGAVRSYRTLSPLPAGRGRSRRFAFCGTFPGVAPAGRYPAPCFRGARTFLPPRPHGARKAAIRPSGTY